MPQRVQLSRRKGWRMPANTVSVARPTRWGNPFRCDGDRQAAVRRHAQWLSGQLHDEAAGPPPTLQQIRSELAGKHLACWCPLDQACHAELLLRLANQAPSVPRPRR